MDSEAEDEKLNGFGDEGNSLENDTQEKGASLGKDGFQSTSGTEKSCIFIKQERGVDSEVDVEQLGEFESPNSVLEIVMEKGEEEEKIVEDCPTTSGKLEDNELYTNQPHPSLIEAHLFKKLLEEGKRHTTFSPITSSFITPVVKNLNVPKLPNRPDKPHICPHCNYCSVNSGNLVRHIQYKHTFEKPHSCSHCSYSTANIRNLNRHIQSKHTNERPYSCPYCVYRAVEVVALKRHIMSKHTNVRPHSCPHCDFSTAHHGTLNRHIRLKHPD